MSSGAPSVSLYITNLNDAVKKDELRRTLYSLFSVYGKVLDVVHTRDPKTRGTAFVVFRDLSSSTSALRALDGEGFFGKQLRISYAKGVSHATVAQTEGPEAVYAIKLGLDKKKGSKLTVSGAQKRQLDEAKKSKRGREDEADEEEDEDEEDGEGPEKKKGKTAEQDDDDDAMEEESDDEAPAPVTAPGPVTAAPGSAPTNILFIAGLPKEVTAEMLLPLFQQYPGLSSLKLLPTPAGNAPNPGLAFVQYETVGQAGTAREALDGFLVEKDAPMSVSWAKNE